MTWKEWYHEVYLKSNHWKCMRKLCLFLAKNCCQECGEKHYQYNLQLHHLEYDNLYDEDPDDLLVLCKECHHNIHFPINNKEEEDFDMDSVIDDIINDIGNDLWENEDNVFDDDVVEESIADIVNSVNDDWEKEEKYNYEAEELIVDRVNDDIDTIIRKHHESTKRQLAYMKRKGII